MKTPIRQSSTLLLVGMLWGCETKEVPCSSSHAPPPSIELQPGMCSPDGWCWINPALQPKSLNAVWVADEYNAWAGGAAGTLLKWDGAQWLKQEIDTTREISAFWGSDANNVWARAGNQTFKWDGTKWALFDDGPAGPIGWVSGKGRGKVWGSNARGNVVEWLGGTWLEHPIALLPGRAQVPDLWGTDIYNLWSLGKNDIYCPGGARTTIYGYQGWIVRWNGTAWDRVAEGGFGGAGCASLALTAIWGTDPNNIWASGPRLLRWDGSDWKEKQLCSGKPPTQLLWGTDANNIWGAWEQGIVKWDGSNWTEQTAVAHVTDIHGSNPKLVWAVGLKGLIMRWDGSQWSQQGGSVADDGFNAAWGTSASNLWLGGDEGVYYWDGARLLKKTIPLTSVKGFWGRDANHIWAGGGGGIARWDGTSWSRLPSVLGFGTAVWGLDENNVWVAGSVPFKSYIMKWDGARWIEQGTSDTVAPTAIWGSDASNVWLGGASGPIMKWNGASWAPETLPVDMQVTSIWGSDPNSVWAIGFTGGISVGTGVILHRTGGRWTTVTSPTTAILNSIWGRDAGHVWIAGRDGTLLKWDGSAWKQQGLDTTEELLDVAGTASGDAWVVGRQGIVLHRRD